MRTQAFESGPATLALSDGRVVTVEARLALSRSFLGVAGEGEFVTDSDIAFDAMSSEEPLKLSLHKGNTAQIVVREAKASQQSARCWFVVRS